MSKNELDHMIEAIDKQLAELGDQLKEVEEDEDWDNGCECCDRPRLYEEMAMLERSIANLDKQRRELLV